MTVKYNSGAVVHDTITNVNNSAVTDGYKFIASESKNLAFAVAEGKDQSDEYDSAAQRAWAKALNSIEDEYGTSLGEIQAHATDFSLSEFEKYGAPGNAINVYQLSNDERDAMESLDVLSRLSGKVADKLTSVEDVKVPATAGMEKIPIFVGSKDFEHNLDEAYDLLEECLEQVGGAGLTFERVDSDSVASSDGDSAKTTESGEFANYDFAPGIGAKTHEKIQAAGFELVAVEAPEADAWESDMTNDPFYVDEEWDEVEANKTDYITSDGEVKESEFAGATMADVAERQKELQQRGEDLSMFLESANRIATSDSPATAMEYLSGL